MHATANSDATTIPPADLDYQQGSINDLDTSFTPYLPCVNRQEFKRTLPTLSNTLNGQKVKQDNENSVPSIQLTNDHIKMPTLRKTCSKSMDLMVISANDPPLQDLHKTLSASITLQEKSSPYHDRTNDSTELRHNGSSTQSQDTTPVGTNAMSHMNASHVPKHSSVTSKNHDISHLDEAMVNMMSQNIANTKLCRIEYPPLNNNIPSPNSMPTSANHTFCAIIAKHDMQTNASSKLLTKSNPLPNSSQLLHQPKECARARNNNVSDTASQQHLNMSNTTSDQHKCPQHQKQSDAAKCCPDSTGLALKTSIQQFPDPCAHKTCNTSESLTKRICIHDDSNKHSQESEGSISGKNQNDAHENSRKSCQTAKSNSICKNIESNKPDEHGRRRSARVSQRNIRKGRQVIPRGPTTKAKPRKSTRRNPAKCRSSDEKLNGRNKAGRSSHKAGSKSRHRDGSIDVAKISCVHSNDLKPTNDEEGPNASIREAIESLSNSEENINEKALKRASAFIAPSLITVPIPFDKDLKRIDSIGEMDLIDVRFAAVGTSPLPSLSEMIHHHAKTIMPALKLLSSTGLKDKAQNSHTCTDKNTVASGGNNMVGDRGNIKKTQDKGSAAQSSDDMVDWRSHCRSLEEENGRLRLQLVLAHQRQGEQDDRWTECAQVCESHAQSWISGESSILQAILLTGLKQGLVSSKTKPRMGVEGFAYCIDQALSFMINQMTSIHTCYEQRTDVQAALNKLFTDVPLKLLCALKDNHDEGGREVFENLFIGIIEKLGGMCMQLLDPLSGVDVWWGRLVYEKLIRRLLKLIRSAPHGCILENKLQRILKAVVDEIIGTLRMREQECRSIPLDKLCRCLEGVLTLGIGYPEIGEMLEEEDFHVICRHNMLFAIHVIKSRK